MKIITFLTIALAATLSFANEGPGGNGEDFLVNTPAQQVGWSAPEAFSCSDAELVDFSTVKYDGLTHLRWTLADGTQVLSVKGGQVDPTQGPSGQGEDFVQQHIIPTQVGCARNGFEMNSGNSCSIRRCTNVFDDSDI